jgi:hypothetical protein
MFLAPMIGGLTSLDELTKDVVFSGVATVTDGPE